MVLNTKHEAYEKARLFTPVYSFLILKPEHGVSQKFIEGTNYKLHSKEYGRFILENEEGHLLGPFTIKELWENFDIVEEK